MGCYPFLPPIVKATDIRLTIPPEVFDASRCPHCQRLSGIHVQLPFIFRQESTAATLSPAMVNHEMHLMECHAAPDAMCDTRLLMRVSHRS